MDKSWSEHVLLHATLERQRLEILKHSPAAASVLRERLKDPGSRGAALELINHVSEQDRKELLPDLMDLACSANKYQNEAFLAVCSLPRRWTAENIEAHSRKILERAAEEEFGLLLHLLEEIRPELCLEIARNYSNHADEGISRIARAFSTNIKGQS